MIHFLPLLFAKAIGKLALKKVAVHHGAHHSVGRKIVKEGAKKAVNTAVDQATAPHEPESGQKS
ncbi:MAG: hypothetical protein WCC96_01310 [Rhodomicrobium sp.]